MKPPPNDALLSAMAAKTSRSVRPYRSSLARVDDRPGYCSVCPPHELISLTPGTERSCVRDVPVVERLRVHRVERVALDQVLVDLAERGGHRARASARARRAAGRAPRAAAR